jgi:threonine synthase
VSSRFVHGLRCAVCGRTYPLTAGHFCADDFGPLEVAYDYEAVAARLTRDAIARRPWTMWRYRELLPLEHQYEPAAGAHAGGTPLVRTIALAAAIGRSDTPSTVWVKNEGVCHPTLSFKDRLVAVAVGMAHDLGYSTLACSSTGNLAVSLAAHAAAARKRCFVFVPADLDPARLRVAALYGARVVAIKGTYDEVNRLCSELADRKGWGFVNANLKPFYLEGARTIAFEIAEQLGWRAPQHLVVPVAGGGMLYKLRQAFDELVRVGLIGPHACKFHAAQAEGCSPVSTAIQNGWHEHRPVRNPKTSCHSLAVGDPGDGFFALRSVRESGGWAAAVAEDEIPEGVTLLARTEGIHAEAAGGVVVAAAQQLIAEGRIPAGEEVVLLLPAHGLKTPEVTAEEIEPPTVIGPSLKEFEALLS